MFISILLKQMHCINHIFNCAFTQLTSTKYKYPTSNDDTTNNKLAYAEYILHLHIQLHAHNIDESEQTCRQSTVSEKPCSNITVRK